MTLWYLSVALVVAGLVALVVQSILEKGRKAMAESGSVCLGCQEMFVYPELAMVVTFQFGGVCFGCVDLGLMRSINGTHGRVCPDDLRSLNTLHELGRAFGRQQMWDDLQSGGPIPEEDLDPSPRWLAFARVLGDDDRHLDYDPDVIFNEHQKAEFKISKETMAGAIKAAQEDRAQGGAA
jgi:hypothetical protein